MALSTLPGTYCLVNCGGRNSKAGPNPTVSADRNFDLLDLLTTRVRRAPAMSKDQN